MELCPKSKSGFPHSIQVDETPRTKEQKKVYTVYVSYILTRPLCAASSEKFTFFRHIPKRPIFIICHACVSSHSG